MGQKRYTAEDIIGHLRTIEIETGKGLAVTRRVSQGRHHRANLLSVEERIRRLARRSGETVERLGTGEYPVETVGGGSALDNSILKEVAAGNCSARARRREAVRHVKDTLSVSERRACRVVGQCRATQQYVPSQADDEEPPAGAHRASSHASMGGTGIGGSRRCFIKKAGT